MKKISEVTKEELIKVISKECSSCMGFSELKVAKCDLITCNFHQYRSCFIDVDKILESASSIKKIFVSDEKKMEKKAKKDALEISEAKKKGLSVKKKPKKGDKV